MKHQNLINVALLAAVALYGCSPEMDDELLEGADDEREFEEEAPDEDQAAGFDAAADELAAEADPSFYVYLPPSASHNNIYNGSFQRTLPNGVVESCSFSFRYGNYGVGYTPALHNLRS